MKPIILFWILVVTLVFRRLSNFTSVPIQPPKTARHTPLTSSKGRSTKAFTTVRASTYPWQILGETEFDHILSFKLLNDNIHRASSEKTGYAPHLIHRPVYPGLFPARSILVTFVAGMEVKKEFQGQWKQKLSFQG